MTLIPAPVRAWWKEATVYQIYPVSFFDSTGDGYGDLNGIRAKLDYLKDLGVDVLWLCPIYKTPFADMGYDISDYRDIDPRYGTLADWDVLLKETHDRGMKMIMDLVVNHTSDEHEWFKESRSSKTNSKRDWYIWRPPRYDKQGNRQPPNNWKSLFQGSAWQYDEATEEYYLHLFLTKQPDLNWENPNVREAVYDLMKFWIDRGCNGFRMDVINLLSKVQGLPDAPISVPGQPYQPASMFFANGPRIHEFVQEMNQRVLSKYNIMTVGEAPFTDEISTLAQYVLPANRELNMVFQFDFVDLDAPSGPEHVPLVHRPWKLTDLRAVVTRWQTYKPDEGFWNSVYIENHDQARSVSRFGDPSNEWRALSAKMLALLQITQTGTLHVYQGEELGLNNFPLSWGIEEYKDAASQNFWNKIFQERKKAVGGDESKVDMSDVLENLQKKARDHGRLPMQWDATENAGFTTGTPWMRVNDDYGMWNAASEMADTHSVLSFWKHALKARKENDVLIYGRFVDVSRDHEQVFAYTRMLQTSTALVVLNFKAGETVFDIESSVDVSDMTLLLSNYNDSDGDRGVQDGPIKDRRITLRGYEGRVYIRKGAGAGAGAGAPSSLGRSCTIF